MSRMRSISACAVALSIVGAACWAIAGALPLIGAPETVVDSPGVTVNTGGSQLLHGSRIVAPGGQPRGAVVVQLKIGAAGEVSDAATLSGPEELRKAVLRAVPDWHFNQADAQSTQIVTVNFGPGPVTRVDSRETAPVKQIVASISIHGLPAEAERELTERLAAFRDTQINWTAIKEVVQAFDPHLILSARTTGGRTAVQILTPEAAGVPGVSSEVFHAGNGVTAPVVISSVQPEYPLAARADKTTGSVVLSVVVGTDGVGHDAKVVMSSDARFDENALEAVSKWRFRPGMKDGAAVSVQAEIEVSFRLL